MAIATWKTPQTWSTKFKKLPQGIFFFSISCVGFPAQMTSSCHISYKLDLLLLGICLHSKQRQASDRWLARVHARPAGDTRGCHDTLFNSSSLDKVGRREWYEKRRTGRNSRMKWSGVSERTPGGASSYESGDRLMMRFLPREWTLISHVYRLETQLG